MQYWTSPGGNNPQSSRYTATYHQSRKLSKLDELSRDELISGVLLWTPSHGRAKVGWPARTYIQQLCAYTGCSHEDLPEAMNDRMEWRERVRDIGADGTFSGSTSKSKHKKFIIFSDSLSVLLSFRNKKIQNPLITKLLSRLDSMFNRKEIIICWTPSHIRVRGNERTDSAAKSALDLTPDKFRIPYTDLKPTINKFLHTKWQQQWSNNIHNKLFQIQPTLGEWRSASGKSRREQVVISRLRIDHARLTHSFIFETGTTTTVFNLPDNLLG